MRPEKCLKKCLFLKNPGNRRNAKRFYLEGMLNVGAGQDSAADSLFVKAFQRVRPKAR